MATTAAQLNVVFNSQGADAVKGDLQSLGTAVDSVGKQFAVIGGAGVAAFGLMGKASMDFTSAMANVNSIARMTTGELEGMSSAILDMASQFGAVPTDLADGLYDIVSSGFEASEALGILEAATVAAGAGLTSTATSAKAITAVLNAYGKGAEEAGNVSDVLFKTVDSGVLTFEELSSSLGRVLPIASSLNISIEELAAGYAELTLQGISASEAETALAAMMTAALNPTTAMTAAIEDYGYASVEALIASEGLAGYLEFLSTAADGSSEGMMDLLGNVRALNGAMVLTGNDVAGFNERLTEMEGAAQDGAYTLEVFGIQMDNAAGAVKLAQAELSAAAINMGSAFEPLVEGAANAVAGVVGAFNDLSTPAQNAVATFGAVASSVALFGGSIALVLPKIAQFRNSLAALRASGTFLGTLAGSMGPLAFGIGAAAAAFVYFNQQANESKAAVADLQGAIETLGEAMQNLRLDHLDAQADMVQAFGTQVLGVQQTARAFLENDAAMMAEVNRIAQEEGRETFDVFMELEEAYTLSSEGAKRFAAAQGEISAAFMDSRIDHAALSAELDSLARQFESFDITYDEYVEGVIAVSQNLSDFRTSAALAEASQRSLREQMASGAITWAQYQEQVNGAADATENFTDKALGSVAGMERVAASINAQREWMTALREATGTADPLSMWTLGTHASDAAELANNLTDASSAAESMFNVIVGGTNAIKNNANAILSWADDLIAVQGEWSRLDELVNKGLITGESGVFGDGSQYAQAQEAYNSIADSTLRIGDNLDAVQAIQAPLMADMLESTAAYTDELLAMEPAAQLVALAWMDSATSARAMELATLGASAAAGELGENGMAAFESMAVGAAQADPALAALLVDMGILEEKIDASGGKTYTVNTAGLEDANSEFALLTNTIADLIDILDNNKLDGSYTIKVDTEVEPPVVPMPDGGGGGGYTGAYWTPPWKVKPEAEAPDWPDWDIPQPDPVKVPVVFDIAGMGESAGGSALGAAQQALGAVNDAITFAVTADTSAADEAIATVQDAVNALDGTSATITITADAEQATGTVTAMGGYEGLTLATAMVMVEGDAEDAIGTVTAMSGYDGLTVATATVMVDGDATDAIGTVTAMAGYEGLNLATATVTVDGDAAPAIGTVTAMGGYEGINLATAMVTVDGDPSGAIGTVTAMSGYEGVNLATAIVSVTGDPSAALGTIQAMSGYEGVNLATAIVSVNGDASQALGVIQAMAGYEGVVLSTAYVNIVSRSIGPSLTEHALGGYVRSDLQLVGEHGPELVSLPYGSYVHPASETNRMIANPTGRGMAGGVNVTFTGDFYGSNREELDDWAETSLVPSLVEALYEERRGQVSA
jgi:TP901 family phage tail tape measure protein